MDELFALFEEQLGGGFKYCFIFTPYLGEDEPILTKYVSNGLVQPPTRQHRTTPFVFLANFEEVHSNKNDRLKAPSLEYEGYPGASMGKWQILLAILP